MRKSPGAETYKLLYARSGNVCAYLDCNHPIFNDDGLYIAELCHIKAANSGGPRYDSSQNDDERSAYENLLFLCHRHHKETDDEGKFPIDRMYQIKVEHERRCKEGGKEITPSMIQQVIDEINKYWKSQESKVFQFEDLKMKTNFNYSHSELFNDITETVELINNYCSTCSTSDDNDVLKKDLMNLCSLAGVDYNVFEHVPYYDNPFVNRNWEYHNIGQINLFQSLRLKLAQLAVKTFECLLIADPLNKDLQKELNNYKEEFENLYDNSYHAD